MITIAFPGDIGAYTDQAPVFVTGASCRVRKPNRRPGSVVTAAVALLVPFLLAAVLTAVLTTPARAAVAGCTWRTVHTDTTYPSGEYVTGTKKYRTCGGTRWEWAGRAAVYPSGERSATVARTVQHREEGRWVTVWEHAVRHAAYPSGEQVTTTTDVRDCERVMHRHAVYPDGRTRDTTTIEPTC